MGWNKERIVFALSILIFVGSCLSAVGSFVGGDEGDVVLSNPREATVGVVGGEITIDWFPGGEGSIRDPFQAKSEWRTPRPDPLAAPPVAPLSRRIPLPAPVAGARAAWPILENSMPEEVNE